MRHAERGSKVAAGAPAVRAVPVFIRQGYSQRARQTSVSCRSGRVRQASVFRPGERVPPTLLLGEPADTTAGHLVEDGGRLALLLITGTMPGVIAGSVIRVRLAPGPHVFAVVVAAVLPGRMGVQRGWMGGSRLSLRGKQIPTRAGAGRGESESPSADGTGGADMMSAARQGFRAASVCYPFTNLIEGTPASFFCFLIRAFLPRSSNPTMRA